MAGVRGDAPHRQHRRARQRSRASPRPPARGAPGPGALIAAGEVHIWWFGLDRAPTELGALHDLLDDQERQRVARFRFPRDADRATAARGVLRELLARYVDLAPRQLRFEYGSHGKPNLADQPIQFNLAHSAGLAVCAVTLDQAVGVDLEHMRADLDHVALARHSFSAAEQAELSRSPGEDTFYRCWTLKEAYIKARGEGLSIPLAAFDVPLGATHLAQPVVSREATSDAHGWFVRSLQAPQGFAASLALRVRTYRLCEWQLPS